MSIESVNSKGKRCREDLRIGTFFFNLNNLYYSGSLDRFIELSKRVRKLVIFYVDGYVIKSLFPKNVAFIKVKAPKIPRIFRCLYLMLKSMQIANEIKRLRVNALYVLSGFWEQNIFALTSKIAHVPLIIRLRGDNWSVRRLSKHWKLFFPIMKFYDAIETFSLNQADSIIAINEFLAKKALAYGVRKEKISVVYHGINSHLFKPEKTEKRDNKFTICCPSRLVRGKGIEDLLEAVRGLDLYLIVIGGGDKDYVERIKKIAPSNVKFLGYVLHQKMPKYINYADIVVSPQHFMGWGRVVLEAMSCSKPVIVTISEENYAKLGFKGWRVDPGDIKELRRAIIEASQTSKETLEKMGEENRRKIIEKFSWEVIYGKILTIINKSIERKKADKV